MEKLIKKYEELCAIPYVKNGDEPYSDISYHLPKLKEYAEKCKLLPIVEMGTRRGQSTIALLLGAKVPVVSVDLVRWDDITEIEGLARDAGKQYKFAQGSSLDFRMTGCSALFIDTYHTASMLEKELALHADKVRQFIFLHDIAEDAYWTCGEDSYKAVEDLGVNCGRGLKYAIEPFLEAHPEWRVEHKSEMNNGLLILQRI